MVMGHYYADMFPNGEDEKDDVHYVPPGQGKRPDLKEFMKWASGWREECIYIIDQKAKCIGVKMK
jgi:hypothetical protein